MTTRYFTIGKVLISTKIFGAMVLHFLSRKCGCVSTLWSQFCLSRLNHNAEQSHVLCHICSHTSFQTITDSQKSPQMTECSIRKGQLSVLSVPSWLLIVLFTVQNGHVKHWENCQFFFCFSSGKNAQKKGGTKKSRAFSAVVLLRALPKYEWCSQCRAYLLLDTLALHIKSPGHDQILCKQHCTSY